MNYQKMKNNYLATEVMSASPNKLISMLYAGAIRAIKVAQIAVDANEPAKVHTNLVKAQDIVMELRYAVNPEVAPELGEQLVALYEFIYQELVDANINKSNAKLDEVIKLLTELADTWKQLGE